MAGKNREKAARFRKGNSFCRNCDLWQVPHGVKCPCGYLNKSRTDKKPTPRIEDFENEQD